MKFCWHKWKYRSNYGTGSVFRICAKCGYMQRWTDEDGWHDWKINEKTRRIVYGC